MMSTNQMETELFGNDTDQTSVIPTLLTGDGNFSEWLKSWLTVLVQLQNDKQLLTVVVDLFT